MQNILLIDDDEDFLQLQCTVLRGAGHSVTTASSGTEGLSLLSVKHFDLVITDIVMPGEDGIAIIIKLRSDFPDVKIIAVSGGGKMDADGYLEIALKLGASWTLSKPFSAKELLHAVNNVLQTGEKIADCQLLTVDCQLPIGECGDLSKK